LCQERLRDPAAKIDNFNVLFEDVMQRAFESVPDGVKVEVVRGIKRVLEGMVDA
ncbi:hypothetical protein RUND412_010596, partial [Rhizina undulata]